MRMGLPAATFRAIDRFAGAVIQPKGSALAILGCVVFDLRPSTDPDVPPMALAANNGAVARLSLTTAELPDHPGDTPTVFAVRREHLAKLAKLTEPGGKVWLDTSDAGLTISMTASPGRRLGSWQVPIANAADLASFPDEPEELAAGESWRWSAGYLADTLRLLAPVIEPGGTLQATGVALAAATWSAAITADAGKVSSPRDAGTLVIPASADAMLRAVGGAEEVTIREGERWLHVQAGNLTLHLAQLVEAVDNIEDAFFSELLAGEDALTVDWQQLTTAVNRASALAEHVRLSYADGTLTVAAADGSSEHTLDAGIGSAEPPEPAVFAAADLRNVLGSLECLGMVLQLPVPGGIAYLANGATVAAVVPLRNVDS